jgi:hypothetical protein
VNATQQVGGALGLAVLATLSTTHTNSLLREGKAATSALTSGYHLAWAVATALLLAAIGAAVTVLRPATTAATGEVQAEIEQTIPEPAYSEAA